MVYLSLFTRKFSSARRNKANTFEVEVFLLSSVRAERVKGTVAVQTGKFY